MFDAIEFSTIDPLEILIKMEERAALMAALSKEEGRKIVAEALNRLRSSNWSNWKEVVRISRWARKKLLEMEGLD